MAVMTPGKALADREAALAELADAREAIASLTEHLNKADARITALTEQLTALKQLVEWYKRQMFGEKSEQFLDEGDDPITEPDMFAAAGLDVGGTLTPSSGDDPEASASPGKKTRRKRGKKKRGTAVNDSGLRFDADVPVETVYLEPEDLDDIPADERELVSEREVCKLVTKRTTSHVVRYIIPVYKHRTTNIFITAPTPPSVFEGSCVDVSFIAGMLNDKFTWHLPLYRQHQRLAAAGIHVSRSSLKNWTRRGIDLLRPIAEAQWQSILAGPVIMMDETYMRAGQSSPGKMNRGVVWPVKGNRGEIVFHYRPDRKAHNVRDILGDWCGTLHTDGYAAYSAWSEAMSGQVSHALCWAHARRKFERCLSNEPAGATRALELIRDLYKAERRAREGSRSGPALLAARREWVVPAMASFWAWHKEMMEQTWLPKDPFYTALCYAGERRTGLELCMTNADVRLDTRPVSA